MTRTSILFVLAAACGSSQRPAPAPLSGDGGGASVPAPSGATWTDDAAMCSNHPDAFGPWNITQAQASERFGAGVTALASIATSQAHPIEVCGVGGENAWLAASTCADGSHPYPGPDAVESSRAGDVGAGGRCGAIIDLYKAQCPERTFDVYMDMYACGPGESFM